MEYAEEEEEEQPAEQVLLEATAAIPNIPVPRSSDGNVRDTVLYWCTFTNAFAVLGDPYAQLRQGRLEAFPP